MRNILTQKQMEIEFAGARPCARSARRQQRASRANWWFNQMRELVDKAFDHEPAPEPRFWTGQLEAQIIDNDATGERSMELVGKERSPLYVQSSRGGDGKTH